MPHHSARTRRPTTCSARIRASAQHPRASRGSRAHLVAPRDAKARAAGSLGPGRCAARGEPPHRCALTSPPCSTTRPTPTSAGRPYRDAQLLAIAEQVGAEGPPPSSASGSSPSCAAGRRWVRRRARRLLLRVRRHEPGSRGLANRSARGGVQRPPLPLRLLPVPRARSPRTIGLAEEIAPVIDALAADIASDAATDMPVRRVFDAYASHSWASGLPLRRRQQPGVQLGGDHRLGGSAAVGAGARERRTPRGATDLAAWPGPYAARTYWTDFDAADPVYDGFAHQVLPLIRRQARLCHVVLRGGPRRLRDPGAAPCRRLRTTWPTTRSRCGGTSPRARRRAGSISSTGTGCSSSPRSAGTRSGTRRSRRRRDLADEHLDDGNTRSYLLAWLMTR